jgi:type II secretory pathway component PulC
MLAMALVPQNEAGAETPAFDSIHDAEQSNLVLVGTLLRRSGSDHHDLALIGEKGHDARWFAIDQAITRDITLVEVRVRSVLLQREGEILELKLSTDTGAVPALEEPAPIPALPAHANALLTPVPGIVPLSDSYFRVSRRVMVDYLRSPQAFEDNGATFLDEGGLFITRLGNESILEKVGLRVGDVLTAVDGEPLKDPLDLQRLLGRFNNPKGLKSIDLEVTRHGAPQRLTYDLLE